ncbi:MAG: hypothetical protein QOK64_06130 [Nitrososphaeraceae archaeon]|nr:hypothetical protein [Nitrososphaeraceae archaeon]
MAEVAVQILTGNLNGLHNGKSYTLTGPEAISYRDAANILSQHIDMEISLPEKGLKKSA